MKSGRKLKRLVLVIPAIFIFCLTAAPQKSLVLHFFVNAGAYQRLNTPVSVDVESIVKSDTLCFQLFEKTDGKLTGKPVQVETGYICRLWFVIDGITRSGERREFFLYKSRNIHVKDEIVADVTPDALILKKGKSEILHYQTEVKYPPDGVDTIYKRNGFIHPVMSPSGNVLTRINPPDHYHHFGIWNPWTRVRTGGHVTDFWNLYEKQGTVKFEGINSIYSGQVFGGFSVKQDHIDFQGENHDKPVIKEIWEVRAWNSNPLPGSEAFLVDLTSSLTIPGDETVILESYRYGGGIGIRANEEWTNLNSSIMTSEGKTRIDADGSRARWTDLNGEFKGRRNSGIVFFSHPLNREHPEPMRVWPPDANNGRGDVYFEFCPIRYKEWMLMPGNVYRLKYRILVYDGKIDREAAERLWNDFAHPPVVKVED